MEEKRSSSELESLELEQVWMMKKSKEDTCLWLAGEANRLWCQNPPSDASTFKPEDCSQFSSQFPFITTSSFHFYQLFFFFLTWISLLCCKTLHSWHLFPWPLLLNKHIVSFEDFQGTLLLKISEGNKITNASDLYCYINGTSLFHLYSEAHLSYTLSMSSAARCRFILLFLLSLF